jgi:hypothetical protein
MLSYNAPYLTHIGLHFVNYFFLHFVDACFIKKGLNIVGWVSGFFHCSLVLFRPNSFSRKRVAAQIMPD